MKQIPLTQGKVDLVARKVFGDFAYLNFGGF